MTEPQLMGLFPTPVLKVPQFLAPDLLKAFHDRCAVPLPNPNSASQQLAHTAMIDPAADEQTRQLCELAAPHLQRFGQVLFADKLNWSVKELWFNRLETGGSQFMHTHANSFVSGIVYLTDLARGNGTVFRKTNGGGEFVFKHDVPLGHYSSDTWILDDARAGDLVLYPSYLLHGVPPNEGALRLTIAFNAIPDHLDSLGYKIQFSA